jgi:hypothetical protein
MSLIFICSYMARSSLTYTSWMEDGAVGHNFERDPISDHRCQVLLNLVQRFLRRRFKCDLYQNIKMNSNFNCSYMAMSSLTYIPGFFCEIFSARIFRLGILWEKNHIKIFCLEIWDKMIFGWPTFKQSSDDTVNSLQWIYFKMSIYLVMLKYSYL